MDERDTPEQLKARALRYLVRREHSRAELARKLAPHAESSAAVEKLLDLLLSRKQQSDERYAEERARALSRKYGAAKIRHDLRSKGISNAIVAAVSSEGELERARTILERKYRAPAVSREERAKRARFLQGRGFSSDVVARLVLDREDPV
ncbi:MAG TPA: recombination regulator RecX [Burkholderiales bacterium]